MKMPIIVGICIFISREGREVANAFVNLNMNFSVQLVFKPGSVNLNMPGLCKQCRSRSVDLELHCLSFWAQLFKASLA